MNKSNLAKQLRKELLEDFQNGNRKGLYAKTQKMMAYNSNKIEGSTLTSEQTASLFDTGSLFADSDTVYRAKDIEEMTGHFSMFNYMLKTINDTLSEDMIKQFHYHLKAGVFEDMANGYLVGQYKNRANQVSDIETSLPSEVESNMYKLLNGYLNVEHVKIDDILMFHADFEQIHPFQDGNGRVGRMIMFRECLVHDIIPVIIKDETKLKYYHALHQLQIEKNISPFMKYAEEQQQSYFKEINRYIDIHLER